MIANPSRVRARQVVGSLAVLVAAVAGTAPGAQAKTTKKKHAAPPAAKVTATAPKAVARGKAAKVTIRVTNATRSRLTGLTLSVAPAKGVAAKLSGARKGRLSETLPTLKGRKSVSVGLTLTPGAKAAASTASTITLRRGGRLVTRATAKVKVATAPAATTPAPAPPAPAPAAPAAPANPLVGRYFFRTYLVGAGMYYTTYYFANASFAYRGRPAGGLPDCPAATAQGDDDGCIPYTYDASTGTVSIDGDTGKLTDPHVLEMGNGGMQEVATPAAGMPLDVYVHALNGSGLCGVSCTFVASDIKFTPDGQFARSSAVSGSTPEGDFAALPPDQHGTYAVQAGGKIVFTYADGHAVTETLGIMYNDADAVDPTYGILLDGGIFWGPTSGV